MRPGQNKRMRGRNNNRRGPNPLTRSYESNGPDVKVRGTAQHIAEKYLQLARDAQSSGDPVMAESYLQHAEHYYRLIAAAQAAQQAQFAQQNGQPRPPQDADFDEDDDEVVNDRFASVAERLPQPQFPQGQPHPQPYQQQPYPERQDRQNFNSERPQQQERQDRPDRHDRQDRQPRQDRHSFDRNQNQQGQNFNRDNRDNRDNRRFRDRDQRPPVDQGERQGDDRPAADDQPVGLPAFITAPPRPIAADAPQPDLLPPSAQDEQGDAGGYHLRPRRRRRPRPSGLVDAAADGPEFTPETGGGESEGE
ncbi:MAG: DUF4167 domain-containing protein [Hyphomicrobiales bacterium]|nr:DUF4167 domain-containing protein [Hyphomicrobiales bacterium]